ncbi:MAG: recombinase family protein [Dolichospermum sp.]
MKLVGYVRVSTKNQEDNTSLIDQERRINAYCEAFGHELISLYVEVGSGKNTKDREQFNLALADVKHNADGIIALKLDRIARNTRDVLALVEDVLQPDNKALVLLDLQVDTSTPTGKMILTVMAATAALERDTINARMQGGRKAKSADGGYAYGSPKFGEKSENKELTTDDQEQEIIKIIKNHHNSGKSNQRIADYLNAKNLPSKRGGQWSKTTVGRVIDRLYPVKK